MSIQIVKVPTDCSVDRISFYDPTICPRVKCRRTQAELIEETPWAQITNIHMQSIVYNYSLAFRDTLVLLKCHGSCAENTKIILFFIAAGNVSFVTWSGDFKIACRLFCAIGWENSMMLRLFFLIDIYILVDIYILYYSVDFTHPVCECVYGIQ